MKQTWIRYLPYFIRQKLEGRHYLQNVVSNTGWQFADNILRMWLGFFVGVWLARYLGPQKYGLFSYAVAFVTLFLPLVTLGLDQIVVRNIVRDPACKDETLGTIFVLKLIGSTASFAAATALVYIMRPADSQSHWLVGIIAAGNLFQSLNVIDIWFNSQLQAKYSVFARDAACIICSVVKVALIMSGAPLIDFALVGTFEAGICALGLVVAYRLTGGCYKEWRGSLEKAKALLRDSWPLIISFLSIGIYQRIDQVMIQEMVGSTEVGIFAVAVRLVEVWIFIPTGIYWSVFPSIVEAKQVSDAFFYVRLQKFYNLMVLLSYVVALPISLLAPWLVKILFGAVYSRAGLMLAALIWVHVFTTLEIGRCAFLTTMNWNRIYFLSVLLGCILNVVLCYFLIPRYGGMGAVAATIMAYWLASHGSCFLFKRTFKTGFMLSKAIVYPKVW
jgi:O-antigen/teichoic acid export membrane protein